MSRVQILKGLTVLTGVGLLTGVACSRSEERNDAPAQTIARPPTPGRSAPAPSGAAPAPAPAVKLVSHEMLATFIPVLDGWTREATQAATVSLPAPASHATVAYTRGNARIDLEITDTGGHPDYVGSLAKIAGTTFSQKAANGYMRGTTIGGHPAVESWNHVDRLGDISVLMYRRFIIHATGTGLDRIETLRDLVETVAGMLPK